MGRAGDGVGAAFTSNLSPTLRPLEPSGPLISCLLKCNPPSWSVCNGGEHVLTLHQRGRADFTRGSLMWMTSYLTSRGNFPVPLFFVGSLCQSGRQSPVSMADLRVGRTAAKFPRLLLFKVSYEFFPM